MSHWHDPSVLAALPDEMAISAVTAAELAAGSLQATTPIEAAKRQIRLQEVESVSSPCEHRVVSSSIGR